MNARMRTEVDLLNESEIDLNECEHFLKRRTRSEIDRSKQTAIQLNKIKNRRQDSTFDYTKPYPFSRM